MTKKQLQIINASTALFTNESIHGTSTSKIAKKAGVSEGLIFRHFKNKEGLIEAILQKNDSHIKHQFTPILAELDAKQLIKKTLELPFILSDYELNQWRLHFKLSWELNLNNSYVMSEIEDALIKAFTKLKYRNPYHETQLMINIIQGFLSSILLGKIENENKTKEFLINKYHI